MKLGWGEIHFDKIKGTLLTKKNQTNLVTSNVELIFREDQRSINLFANANHLSIISTKSHQKKEHRRFIGNSFLQLLASLEKTPNITIKITNLDTQLSISNGRKINLPKMSAFFEVRDGKLNSDIKTVTNKKKDYHLEMLIDSLGNTRGKLSYENDLIFTIETIRTSNNQLELSNILELEALTKAWTDEKWSSSLSWTDVDFSQYPLIGKIQSNGKFNFSEKKTLTSEPYFHGKVRIDAESKKLSGFRVSQIAANGDLSISWDKSFLEFTPEKDFTISNRLQESYPKISSEFVIKESGPITWHSQNWTIPNILGNFFVRHSEDNFTGNFKFSREIFHDDSPALLDHTFLVKSTSQRRPESHTKMEGEIFFRHFFESQGSFFEPLSSASFQWGITPQDTQNYDVKISGIIGNLPITKHFFKIENDYLEDMEIKKGSAQINYYSSIGKDFSVYKQNLTLRLNDVQGSLNGYQFSGLDTSAKFTNQANIWESEDIKIRLEYLNIGFVLKNIYSSMQLSPQKNKITPNITIKKLDGEIFKGQISLQEGSVLSLPTFESETKLVIKGWQLEEILDHYSKRGISGAGRISGQLPLSLSPNKLIINEGKLHSIRPGGVISIKTGKDSVLNPKNDKNIATILRLLENFQYEELEIATNLNQKGDLVLNIVISGSNPEELKGQPIILNVNIEQNLLDLIKSMTITNQTIKRVRNIKQEEFAK